MATAILDASTTGSRPAYYSRIAIVFTLLWHSLGSGSLTRDLIYGTPRTATPAENSYGRVRLVWVNLVVTFAFLYWELDLGGRGQRVQKERQYPDLGLLQDLNREVRRPGWRPVFTDYLYLGPTNGLAFSPIDTMLIASWASSPWESSPSLPSLSSDT